MKATQHPESPGEFLRSVSSELGALFPGLETGTVRMLSVRDNRHSWTLELSLRVGNATTELVIKRPKSTNIADVRATVAGVIRTSNSSALRGGEGGFVRFPEIVGVILENTALVMRRIDGTRLDEAFGIGSKIDEKRCIESLRNLGKWLRSFHEASTLPGGARRAFPFQIRPYQDSDCTAVPIERCLERMGINVRAIELFLRTLERVSEAVPKESKRLTQTFGDFRVWNVIISAEGDYLSDLPVVLCWDNPWRDISAMITSIEYMAARPRNLAFRKRIQPERLTQHFLSSYFDESLPSAESVDLLNVPAMLASIEDLGHSKRIQDLAAKLWIERRVRSVLTRVGRRSAQ